MRLTVRFGSRGVTFIRPQGLELLRAGLHWFRYRDGIHYPVPTLAPHSIQEFQVRGHAFGVCRSFGSCTGDLACHSQSTQAYAPSHGEKGVAGIVARQRVDQPCPGGQPDCHMSTVRASRGEVYAVE